MARSEVDQTASFMMYLLWRFPSSLCIPRKFVTKYKQVANQVSMMLETDDDGKYWEVKIKNIEGDYHMKDGWPEFIKDNHIDETDFLTFRLLDQTTFKVVIYRSDGYPRALTSRTSSGENERKKGEGGSTTSKRKRWTSNPLYFEILLKKHHCSRVHLPKVFRDAAGIEEKRHVMLEFVASHRCQKVVVDYRPQYRVDLAKGWFKFREANRLVYGKPYSFEFDHNKNVIYVKEVVK